MSVRKPRCECCGRVRKEALKVARCVRCKKYVCENEFCRIPHSSDSCGDQFVNAKVRAKAKATVEA